MGVLSENAIIGASNASGYEIDNSSRWEPSDSPVLKRDVTVAGNRRTSTWSAWVKIGWNTFSRDDGTIEPFYTLFCCGNSDGRWNVGFSNATAINNNLPQLFIGQRDSGGGQAFEVSSSQAFRDPSAWYHIVVVMDTTQSTNTDRVKAYVNGERITDWGVTSWPSQNYDSDCFRTADPTVRVRVGNTTNQSNEGARFWNGYISEVHVVDGQALLPSSFGETDPVTNQWKPIKYAGTYGTNGFYLKFTADKSLTDFEDTSTATTGSHQFVNAGALTCDYLLVGGGGGGGNHRGGGGGSGGFATASGQAVPAGTHDIYVGQGGQGMCGDTTGNPSPEPPRQANSGQDTVWLISGQPEIRAGGGGGGSSYGNPTSPSGGAGRSGTGAPAGGGSGGGGGAQENQSANPGGTGAGPGTARPGGPSNASQNYAGAGGGAGGTGGTGGGSGAEGGSGTANSYQTDSSITYGGGGGSGNNGFGEGDGGSGGGGQGGNADGQRGSQPGWNGTGGGGGGHGQQNGGNGGTGTAIIRYQANSAQATGGVITTYGSGASQYYVHTFEAAHKRKNMEAFGNVHHSTVEKKFGASSIRMDRSNNSYITASTKDAYASGVSALGAADFDPLQNDWTMECFAKLDAATGTVNEKFFGIDFGSYSLFHFGRNSANALTFEWYETQGNSGRTMQYSLGVTTSAGAGPSDTNWHHYALVRYGSNINIYFDGTSVGVDAIAGNPVIRSFNSPFNIGYDQNGGYVNGYMDEIRWSNVARYTGSFTPPTAAFTSDSDTVFLLQSDVTNTLGSDYSGQNNTFTATNLDLTDQVIDTPTNEVGGNFCTLNPLLKPGSAVTYSEGNLAVTSSATSYPASVGTMGVSAGKWYFEVLCTNTESTNNDVHVGWVGDEANKIWDGQANSYNGSGPSTWYYSDDGKSNVNNTTSTYGPTYTTGDIIGATINFDDSEIQFYKNNMVAGTAIPFAANVTAAKFMVPGVITQGDETVSINFGQDSSFAGWQTPQGNSDSNDCGDFYYTPPAGFLAICTDNLPDPAIALPGEYFSNIIYTGNGASPSPTRVLGLQPDFVWVKQSDGTEANAWYDTPRGTNNQLRSNTTGMQTANAETLKTFAATGFTTGSDDVVNSNTKNYVAYGWLAGGAPTVDNSAGAGNVPTAGSVKINGSNYGSAMAGTLETKRMSANTTSGFSINSFIGNETAGATIAHGLSQKPDWVIAKVYVVGGGAATSVWYTQPLTIGSFDQGHGSMSFDQGGFDNYAGYWNDVAPNSSVVTLGAYSNLNRSSNIIMYSFHSVEGYSKFGSYQGNGNADGTFIYTGFRPKFFITKNMSQSEHWNQWGGARESYNKMTKKLSLSENIAEYTGNTTTYAIDFVSNGVKLRSSYSSLNDNSDYFYYAAFAESPFKTSRAR